MMQAARSWDDLKQTPRSLERQLEVNITALNEMSKRMNKCTSTYFDEGVRLLSR